MYSAHRVLVKMTSIKVAIYVPAKPPSFSRHSRASRPRVRLAEIQARLRRARAATKALAPVLRLLSPQALRRYDRDTEHDHWASAKKRTERANAAIERVAKEMGLPVAVVAPAASRRVDEALASLN